MNEETKPIDSFKRSTTLNRTPVDTQATTESFSDLENTVIDLPTSTPKVDKVNKATNKDQGEESSSNPSPNDSERDSSDNDSNSGRDSDKEDDDSKKGNNTDSDSDSDSEIVNTVTMAQPITLKDALKVVLEYDGKYKSLSLFLKGCSKAKAMIASVDKENLTKLIRGKLTDEARNSIYGQTFKKIDDLTDFIKNIYYNARNIPQLEGEMGREYQRDNEPVIA